MCFESRNKPLPAPKPIINSCAPTRVALTNDAINALASKVKSKVGKGRVMNALSNLRAYNTIDAFMSNFKLDARLLKYGEQTVKAVEQGAKDYFSQPAR